MLEQEVVVLGAGFLLDPLRLSMQLVKVVDLVFEQDASLHLSLVLLLIPPKLQLRMLSLPSLLLHLLLQLLTL